MRTDRRTVEISLIALEGLVDFIMMPEVQAVIDGAFDPDAYVREAQQAIKEADSEQQ